MYFKKTLCLITALLTLFSLSCHKKEPKNYYRFIDHMDEGNILRSPFQDMARDPERFKRDSPELFNIVAQKYPLLDSGIKG